MRTIPAIASAASVYVLSVVVAHGQAGQAPRPQMSEDVCKNVQILKGIPVVEFMDTMGMFAAALSRYTLAAPATARIVRFDLNVTADSWKLE